jgi:peptidoglycan/xylan/chitin deacetylase (PgdA/CDA1 family)
VGLGPSLPCTPAAFEPNRILRVTPQFLEQAIAQIRQSGFEIISLDDAHFRLLEKDFRPFACLTFDDGYRDNLEVAYPIFKRHNLPFAVYICTDFADGRGDLWWLALEKAILRTDSVSLRIAGSEGRWPATSAAAKDATFHAIYWWLRSIKEDDARAVVAELCRATGFDPSGLCPGLVMTWDEIRRLAADPLVTIGAHTRRHLALAKLTLPEARDEIAQSLARIERELGVPCRHLSYPYGDERSAGEREFQLARELGFRTGVTTRKGLIQRRHTSALTGLPRVSLNGDYQQARYVKVSLNGVPFAFANRRQRPAGQTAPFH